MLKIKRTLNDHIKEDDFQKYMFIDPEKIQKLSGNLSKRLLNHFLPPTKKFLRESFNAINDGKILAQISLIPDNFSNYRWQISSLKIRNDFDYAAKPLIDFVVNKYGGNGVSSFLVYIDENLPQIISLFKNECGFRSCAKIDFYKITSLEDNENNINEKNFLPLSEADILPLLEINTANIFSNFRPSLISDLKDFKQDFFEQTRNDYLRVFSINGKQEGYFRIYSNDKKNFFVDVITSKPYEHCYYEIISYIHNLLKQVNNLESVTFLVKKYRETSGALEEALRNKGYLLSETTQILVKDYWNRIDDVQSHDKLFVFFNDLSAQPARYNSYKV